MDRINMKTELGTKWFTFFTKVRPWFFILSGCIMLSEYIAYFETYVQHWWAWVSFLLNVILVILQGLVVVTSMGDYSTFVRFVEVVLAFETIIVSWEFGLQGYLGSVSEGVEEAIAIGVVGFVFVFVLVYFIWYRWNCKYFRKRLRAFADENIVFVPDCNSENQVDIVVVENTESVYCAKCGKRMNGGDGFCAACGWRNDELEHKSIYRIQPIELRSDFVDTFGWSTELASLKSDEVYRRYCDIEEWSEDYRALCYQELVKRQEKRI